MTIVGDEDLDARLRFAAVEATRQYFVENGLVEGVWALVANAYLARRWTLVAVPVPLGEWDRSDGRSSSSYLPDLGDRVTAGIEALAASIEGASTLGLRTYHSVDVEDLEAAVTDLRYVGLAVLSSRLKLAVASYLNQADLAVGRRLTDPDALADQAAIDGTPTTVARFTDGSELIARAGNVDLDVEAVLLATGRVATLKGDLPVVSALSDDDEQVGLAPWLDGAAVVAAREFGELTMR